MADYKKLVATNISPKNNFNLATRYIQMQIIVI